jgi:hypothetical protein
MNSKLKNLGSNSSTVEEAGVAAVTDAVLGATLALGADTKCRLVESNVAKSLLFNSRPVVIVIDRLLQ